MDMEARRRLIIAKSPITRMVDPRPRCNCCGRVLTTRDFEAYRDGSAKRETPSCCEDCAERETLP